MDSQSPKIGETISYTQLKDNVTNIQSLCPNCFKTGETKLLLSKIKHFGDIIISSFICDHCHLKNTDVSPSIPIQSSGTRIEITITTKADMNRQVVKTKYARIIVPVLEFEREPSYGEITTIEGLLSNAIIHINKNAKIIAKGNPDVIQNIVEFVEKMQDLMSVKSSWLLIIDDVSGNSYVENIKYPKTDSNLIIMPYFRNKEQNEQVGIFTPQEEYKVGPGFGVEETITNVTTDEVNCMQVSCPNCDAVGQNNVKLVDIPFFKEIILMAFCCDECGFRDSEVKGGLSFDEKGKRLTLTITKKNDLSRDFLTSEFCTITIPEIDVDTSSMEFSGHFTTVEGFLKDLANKLERLNIFSTGDSSKEDSESTNLNMRKVLSGLRDVVENNIFNLTLILNDPTGNSYIQFLDETGHDENLSIELYDRTDEENETFGLNHNPDESN